MGGAVLEIFRRMRGVEVWMFMSMGGVGTYLYGLGARSLPRSLEW